MLLLSDTSFKNGNVTEVLTIQMSCGIEDQKPYDGFGFLNVKRNGLGKAFDCCVNMLISAPHKGL